MRRVEVKRLGGQGDVLRSLRGDWHHDWRSMLKEGTGIVKGGHRQHASSSMPCLREISGKSE